MQSLIGLVQFLHVNNGAVELDSSIMGGQQEGKKMKVPLNSRYIMSSVLTLPHELWTFLLYYLAFSLWVLSFLLYIHCFL